ncbi:hypothetical protein GCM10011491_37000 [Brucella endophytica]|uniref:Uncharacterized protein n=1 Tax=Brucella endophytica TaxID=1963359 RepID=A0A916SKX5_9HYPH|nr:hypothetical protein GCM10011491_37000 [Brucella endophytica]
MKEIVKEQNQHGIDAEDTDCHGNAEALEQFGTALQFSLFDQPNALRQVLERGQRLSLAIDIVENSAVELEKGTPAYQPPYNKLKGGEAQFPVPWRG